LTGDPAVSDVAELFVLGRYRRHRVGMRAAHLAFDRYPGAWEVRQRSWNTAATAFWRRAIGAYTGGVYTEQVLDDDRWTGPVQTFTRWRTPSDRDAGDLAEHHPIALR
jgi:predicted acetyltransferase